MNKQILNHVMPYLDFTNDENNIKKRDNKKSAYKLKMLKDDDKDLLTQMTKLFYDKIMYQSLNIVQSPENPELKRENNELKKKLEKCNKENERLKDKLTKSNKEIKDLEDELNEYDITLNNLENELNELKDKYIIPVSKPKPVVDDIPSILDEPVYYDNNTTYDPYNITYNNNIEVSDILQQDINNIITYNGISYDEWFNLSDIEKINLYNTYNNIDDGSISNMKLKKVM